MTRELQGTGEGMAEANHPIEKVRALQRALYAAAKQQRQRMFHALYDRIARPDVLRRAWEQVRRNKGAAGVDGETLEAIETYGVEKMLEEQGLHPEAGKAEGAPSIANPAGAGPGGADRGQAGARTYLRSQLPAVLFWVQAQAEGSRRVGGHPQGSEQLGRVRLSWAAGVSESELASHQTEAVAGASFVDICQDLRHPVLK